MKIVITDVQQESEQRVGYYFSRLKGLRAGAFNKAAMFFVLATLLSWISADFSMAGLSEHIIPAIVFSLSIPMLAEREYFTRLESANERYLSICLSSVAFGGGQLILSVLIYVNKIPCNLIVIAVGFALSLFVANLIFYSFVRKEKSSEYLSVSRDYFLEKKIKRWFLCTYAQQFAYPGL